MGKLVSIVGNSGAGKTLLTRLLCEAGPFGSCFEQHAERPFQTLFMQDLDRYALPNQVDYLLYRAEQEWTARQSPEVFIEDGGLDLDYQVFTHLFLQKGYLDQAAFDLCQRFYALLRNLMPSPDLTIYLDTPVELVAERRRLRNRAIDIAKIDDLEQIQQLLDRWLAQIPTADLIRIDASSDPYYRRSLPVLIERIRML